MIIIISEKVVFMSCEPASITEHYSEACKQNEQTEHSSVWNFIRQSLFSLSYFLKWTDFDESSLVFLTDIPHSERAMNGLELQHAYG